MTLLEVFLRIVGFILAWFLVGLVVAIAFGKWVGRSWDEPSEPWLSEAEMDRRIREEGLENAWMWMRRKP